MSACNPLTGWGTAPEATFTIGQAAQTVSCYSLSQLMTGQCNTCRFRDSNLQPLSATTTEPIRNGQNCVRNPISATQDQFDWNCGPASENYYWGNNPAGYEDFSFVVEYWQNSAPETSYFKTITLRVKNMCLASGAGATSFSVSPLDLNTFAGATLSKPAHATVRTTSVCSPNSSVSVRPQGSTTFVTSTDPFYSKVINSFAQNLSGANFNLDFVFLTSVPEFGAGSSTSSVTVDVRIDTWTPGSTAQTTFILTIHPTSKIVEMCNSQQPLMIATSMATPDYTYTIGSASIAVGPSSFTATSCTDNLGYGNTLLPIQAITKSLQYQDSSGTWQNFPTTSASVLFFSTNNDASCVSSIDSSTLGFTLYCTDPTKFVTSGGSVSFNLRYSAQFAQVSDQPSTPILTSDPFFITITNPCGADTITLPAGPGSIDTYSGATYQLTALAFTHGINPVCSAYHTILVEVSRTSNTGPWFSSGSTYSDLISTANTDLAITVSPNSATYDAGGGAPSVAYIQVKVSSTFSTMAPATYLYNVNIYSKAAIADLANTQAATTMTLTGTHVDVYYTVGDPPLLVSPTPVTVSAPVAAPNVNMPSAATETKLFYTTTSTQITSAASGTFLSTAGATSCMINMNPTSIAFYLYCTNNALFNWPGGTQTFPMKFTTSFVQINGLPAAPTTVDDTFTIHLYSQCYNDVLTQLSTTSNKVAYADVTMNIPASSWQHSNGITEANCPSTLVTEVSADSGTTWATSGAVYTDLITANNNGALTIKPSITVFGGGPGTSTRLVKLTRTNVATSQSIVDQFIVTIRPTADIAVLANGQLSTLAFNPHSAVTYTVGDPNLAVSTSDIIQTYPVDSLGFNDFSTTPLPALSYKLQFLSAGVWTDITSGNYQTTGIVGLSNTPCMLNGSLDAQFAFTMSCTDNSKFGTSSSGQSVYSLRYVVWYTDVSASIRYMYDPFSVTILNQCADATLSLATGTSAQTVYVTSAPASVPSQAGNIVFSPATCSAYTALVEVLDGSAWTSLVTNPLYAALITSANSNPALTIQPAGTYFTSITTVQVRVTYSSNNSQLTNGQNKVIDQFAVNVYPSPYLVGCALAVSSETPIPNFALDVYNAAGTSLSDQTFGVIIFPAICAGVTFTFDFNDPALGYITNPYGAYFSVAAATGVLTYAPPPSSFMNGLSQMLLNYRITATLNSYPSTKAIQYLTITLNNACATSQFSNPSSQAAIYYEDGSAVASAVPAFTYSTTQVAATDANCGFTETIMFRNTVSDAWSAAVPAYVQGAAITPSTLAFSIFTNAMAIATPGDVIASRWVQRTISNPHNGQQISQEFQIFFVTSTYCMSATASLLVASTLDLTQVVVGTTRVEPAQLDTSVFGLTTGATSTLTSNCHFDATCQIFDSTTQTWIAAASWPLGGISCSSAGQWTISIPTTNTNYNPSMTLQMRVTYTIPDSQVPSYSSPSRSVVSQFSIQIVNECATSAVTAASFPDVTYYVGLASTAITYSPVFSGALNSQCPQIVSMSLRLDSQGSTWNSWSPSTFNIGGTTYSFITNLVTTGLISQLGAFTISETTQSAFRPNLKFNAMITLTNAQSGLTSTLQFNINMVDVCSVNAISQASTQSNIIHTIQPASTATGLDTINWTTLTQNTISTYNGGASAGTSCPITRTVFVQRPDSTWLQATNSAVTSTPVSYSGKIPPLDWVINYSNQAAGNLLLTSSQAFQVDAQFSSAFLTGLFQNNVGLTFNVKMVSLDPFSLTSQNQVVETFTVTFARACATDTVCITSDGVNCLTTSQFLSVADASPNLNYIAGSGLKIIPKSGKNAITGCPLSVTYQYQANGAWTDFSSILHNAITSTPADGSVNVLIAAGVGAGDDFCPQQSFVVRITYTSTESLSSQSSAYDEFTVIINAYASSQITLKSTSIPTYTYNVPAAASLLVINPIGISNTVTWVGCPVTCELQLLDASNNWNTYASTAQLSFVTSGAGVCGLTVNFLLTDTFWTGASPNLNSQTTTYSMRIGVQYSNLLPGPYAVYDQFNLLMQSHCSADYFTLIPKADFPQTIYPAVQGDATFGKTAVGPSAITQFDTTCPVAQSLEIYDPVAKVWLDYNSLTALQLANYPYIQNYVAATATFDVMFSSDLGSTFGGTSVDLRIKTTDSSSTQAAGTVYDQFKVTFVYLCATDSISVLIANLIPNQVYTYGQAATPFPTPVITHANPACNACLTTFSMFAYFPVSNAWLDFADVSAPLSTFISSFNPTTGVGQVSCAGTENGGIAPSTGVSWLSQTVVQMKIVANSVYSTSSTNTIAQQFSLTMSNLCAANQLSLSTLLANQNGGATISSFTYYLNDLALPKLPLYYSIQANSDCPITAKLYVFNSVDASWSDITVPPAPYNSWIQSFNAATGQLTIYEAGSYVTPTTYTLRITLTDPASLLTTASVTSQFQVTIDNVCSTNPYTLSPQADIPYSIPATPLCGAVTCDASSPVISVPQTSLATANNPLCTLSYRTEIWNVATQSYVALTQASVNAATYNFIQTASFSDTQTVAGFFDTNAYNLYLPFSSLSAFVSTYGTSVQMRSVVSDVTGKVLYDTYTITFDYACWADQVSILFANNIPDQIYQFGSGPVSLVTPVITQTVLGCPMTFDLWGNFNQLGEQNSWFEYSSCGGCLSYIVSGFSTTTGNIQVDNADGHKVVAGDNLLLPQATRVMKIVATSTYSLTTLKVVEDAFTLTMRQSACVNNLLAFDGSLANVYGTAAVANVNYQLGNLPAVTIDPLYSALMTDVLCPLSAQFFIFDSATNLWVQDSGPAFTQPWIQSFQQITGASIAGHLQIYQADTGFLPTQTYSVKIVISDPLSMSPATTAITTYFTVTIYHKCSLNSFTLTPTPNQSYLIGIGSTTIATVVPASSTTGVVGNTVGCPLQYSFEIYSAASLSWTTVTQANAGSIYSFIVAASVDDTLTTNTFDVQTNNFALWADTVQTMRHRVQDPNSSQAGANQVSQFTVTITYPCLQDQVSITTQATNQIYVFGATTPLTPPTFSQSVPACASTLKLEIFDTPTNSWVNYVPITAGYDFLINNWNSVTGVVTILNNGLDGLGNPTLKPQATFQMQISMTSTDSLTSSATAASVFTLTLQEGCFNNQLAMDGTLTFSSSGIVIPNQTYKVSTTALTDPQLDLTPLYSSTLSPASCPLTATLFVWDNLNNVWVDQSLSVTQPWIGFFKLDSAPFKAGRVLIYQDSNVFLSEQTYQVKIVITDPSSANPNAIAISHTFTVNIYHACSRSSLSISADQANVPFTILANTPATSIPAPVLNSPVVLSDSDCTLPINYSLEIYSASSLSWVQYTSALTATYPWITSWTDPVVLIDPIVALPVYTTSNNGFQVFTSDFLTYTNSNFQLRMKVLNVYSSQGPVYDYFNVQITYECINDVVTLGPAVGMYVYSTLSLAPTIYAANFAQSIALCQMSYKIEAFSPTTLIWNDITAAGAGEFNWRTGFAAGALTVQTTQVYVPYIDYQIRITYTSQYSQMPTAQRTQVDTYVLRITQQSTCFYDILTKTSELPDQPYIVSTTSGPLLIQPLFTQLVGTCVLTQKLYFLNTATNTWVDNVTLLYPFVTFVDGLNAVNPGQLTISATRGSVATTYWKPYVDYTAKITITDAYANNQMLTYQFNIQLRDVCADNTVTKLAELPATTTYIIGSADTILMPSYNILNVIDGCLSVATLEFVDTVTNQYIVDNTGATTAGTPYDFVKQPAPSGFSTTTGQLTVNTSNVAKYSISKTFQVRIIINLPESISLSNTVQYYFSVTIQNGCANDILTLTTDLTQKIYYIDYLNPNALHNLVITPTVSQSGGLTLVQCPLTASVQMWNPSTFTWVDASTQAWVQSFTSANTGVLNVYTSSTAYHPISAYPNNAAWTDISLRITFTDPYSQSIQSSVSDVFSLSIRRACSDSTLTQVATIGNQVYFIGSGLSAGVTPSFTILPASDLYGDVCSPFFYLHFWNTVSLSFVEYSAATAALYPYVVWNSVTGLLQINTANFALDITIVSARITTTTSVSTVLDTFTITIQDQCRTATLVTPLAVKDLGGLSHTSVNPFAWHMWQYAQANFAPVTVSVPGCPITYEITDTDAAYTPIDPTICQIDEVTNPLLYQVQCMFTAVQTTRFYYVRAIVKTQNGAAVVITSQDKYFLKVTDSCILSNQILSQPLPISPSGVDYWIGDAVASTVDITPFQDFTTVTYGNQINGLGGVFVTGTDLCGPKSYALYQYYNGNLFTALPLNAATYPWISLTFPGPTYLLSVGPEMNPLYYTNTYLTFWIQVSLTDYSAMYPIQDIHWERVDVMLLNCQVTDLTFPAVAPITYCVYTPEIHIPLTQFTEVDQVGFVPAFATSCGYPITYTATWLDYYGTIIALPSFITWDPILFQYVVQTSSPTDVTGTRQTYTLQLTASISTTFMNPGFSKTQSVTLVVNNCCLNDQLSVLTGVSNYVYYINENTEQGTWVQGNTPIPKIQTWSPQWTQSVQGCPVQLEIFRTVNGVRSLIGAYENAVLYSFTIPAVPLNVLWSTTSLTVYPYTATIDASTSDYSYDLQSWQLSVALVSTFSTSTLREADANFNLDLRDVCWDLPLSSFDISPNPLPSYYVGYSHQIAHAYMIDSWSDYCTGSSYSLQYVSGPLLAPGGDPLTVNMNQFYSDFTQYNTPSLTGLPYLEGVVTDFSWVGTHTVQLVAQQGTTKLYNVVYGTPFQITFINPCTIAVVQASPIADMTFTEGDLSSSTQNYIDFNDDVSSFLGNGYNTCGPRSYQLVAIDGIYEFTSLFVLAVAGNTTPGRYQIQVFTTNYSFIGNHAFNLVVGLQNYPTATSVTVPFNIMIAPCIVTGYTANPDYQWAFTVGNPASNFIFNFKQEPCLYQEALSAKLASGAALPSFVTMSAVTGQLRVQATDPIQVGVYEIVVTGRLNNIDIFGDPASTIDPSLKINPLSPPLSFIYTSSFTVQLTVVAPVNTFVPVNSNNPFFLPSPDDIWFYASNQFVKSFGPAFDMLTQQIVVSTNFGQATRFIQWDPLTNTLSVDANATSSADIGEYPLLITLTDDVVQGQAPNTWFGNITYQFALMVLPAPPPSTSAPLDPRIEVVFAKYNSSVIDVRTFDRNAILNATDVTNKIIPTPKFADPNLKQIEVSRNQSKQGETNATIPELPRIVMTQHGVIQTNMNSLFTDSERPKQEDYVPPQPPKPFVQSLTAAGQLTIGFDKPMKVPASLDGLNKEKVALRWMSINSTYTNETYLTPDGFLNFEIHPAVDLSLIMSPDSPYQNQKFTYEITGFTENDMTINIKFETPDFISTAGVSTDQLKVTFWTNEYFQAQNGLAMEEGQTLAKHIIQQVNPTFDDALIQVGQRTGVLVAITVGGGVLIAILFGFDQTPFWLFFNIWQLFLHVPLLNLKLPGFIGLTWREQLKIWTLRSCYVNQLMHRISGIPQFDRKSYTLLLENVGFNSTEIYVNLGLILWIPAMLVALMPFAWLIDTICTVRDPFRDKFGGRKPLTRKPLIQSLVNILTRYALISVLDIMICVFISLSSASDFGHPAEKPVNRGITYALLGLLSFLVLLEVSHGLWRRWKAQTTKDFKVSGYISTLYEGANLHHPQRTTFYLAVYMLRQTIYAATIVYLYEDPVFQLYVLLATSILYNCLLANTQPFHEWYNMALLYLNELSFFFLLAMSMTFTDFVTDVYTRSRTGMLLSTFMFAILSLNVTICIAAIIWTHKWWLKMREEPENSETQIEPEKVIAPTPIKTPVQPTERPIMDENQRNEQEQEEFNLYSGMFDYGNKTVEQILDSVPLPHDVQDKQKGGFDFAGLVQEAIYEANDPYDQQDDRTDFGEPQDAQIDMFYKYLNRAVTGKPEAERNAVAHTEWDEEVKQTRPTVIPLHDLGQRNRRSELREDNTSADDGCAFMVWDQQQNERQTQQHVRQMKRIIQPALQSRYDRSDQL